MEPDSQPIASTPVLITRSRIPLLVWIMLAAWLAAMWPLAHWGLPSRANDDLLFGGQPAWLPERFQAGRMAEQRAARGGGADTDADPLRERAEIQNLTSDETARAAILLRYRLYSRQPDEMITFMALQRMHPRQGDFDPKLYQYGGGYIYLVGASLALASATGAVQLTSDITHYLKTPEDFGAFYVISRGLSLLFGAAALLAVFQLSRRLGGEAAGWLGMLLTAVSPVFLTLALEAKPHLPSTALLLWAVLAALDCAQRNQRYDWWRLALFAGGAFAFVLTGLVALVLPALLLFCPLQAGRSRWRAPLLCAAGAVAIYVALNPYIFLNLLFRRNSLGSNLGNSTAMYSIGANLDGAARTLELLIEAAGFGTVIAGAIALFWAGRRCGRALLLAAGPGIALLLICSAIGAGKPAEFARFLLFPASLLAVVAAAGLAALGRYSRWAAMGAAAGILLSVKTPEYVSAFAQDALQASESRRIAAAQLASMLKPTDPLGVTQEPAPYAIPPVDFVQRNVLWLPPELPRNLQSQDLPPYLVLTADSVPPVGRYWWQKYYELFTKPVPQSRFLAQITWADKPVFIYQRRHAATAQTTSQPPTP